MKPGVLCHWLAGQSVDTLNNCVQTKEVRAEDINNSVFVRVLFGVFLLWLMTGIPLKWLLPIIAMVAGGAYLYGQVHLNLTFLDCDKVLNSLSSQISSSFVCVWDR